MESYITLVKTYPIPMAMLQFALMGTLGELASAWIVRKKFHLPFGKIVILKKMLAWALIAIFIKYAFVGFKGFIECLITNGYLPELNLISSAFARSVAINLQFGPFLVLGHRLLDNLIDRQDNWQNIDKGLYSLLWFWIPAHTVTFTLPQHLQIGLAALWSVVLGLILGYFKQQSNNTNSD